MKELFLICFFAFFAVYPARHIGSEHTHRNDSTRTGYNSTSTEHNSSTKCDLTSLLVDNDFLNLFKSILGKDFNQTDFNSIIGGEHFDLEGIIDKFKNINSNGNLLGPFKCFTNFIELCKLMMELVTKLAEMNPCLKGFSTSILPSLGNKGDDGLGTSPLGNLLNLLESPLDGKEKEKPRSIFPNLRKRSVDAVSTEGPTIGPSTPSP